MSELTAIHKYPRTPHILGSGLQADDDTATIVAFADLAGRYLVVEEKMDGANSAISFAADGRLLLQSRGHYLTGGPRERQFDLFKRWARRYTAELWNLLGDRYILYGEWLYAKHTIYYTDLPHYFLEFDIYDIQEDAFLSTVRRRELLRAAPFLASVLVLREGTFDSLAELTALIGPSHFITVSETTGDHLAGLRGAARAQGIDPQRAVAETDPTPLMEGLYVKVEEGGRVTERYKYVRRGFLQTVIDSQSHWMDRPLLPNSLRAGASLL